MPGQFLSAAERERLERFPQEIAERDLNTFFTLSARLSSIRQQYPLLRHAHAGHL